jgi:hypothetical protein
VGLWLGKFASRWATIALTLFFGKHFSCGDKVIGDTETADPNDVKHKVPSSPLWQCRPLFDLHFSQRVTAALEVYRTVGVSQ